MRNSVNQENLHEIFLEKSSNSQINKVFVKYFQKLYIKSPELTWVLWRMLDPIPQKRVNSSLALKMLSSELDTRDLKLEILRIFSENERTTLEHKYECRRSILKPKKTIRSLIRLID